MSTAPKSMSSKLQHPLRSGHFSYFCNMLCWKASSKIIALPACTAFSTAKKELYLQYIRFKFSNNSIPTCPICCCLWHISRAACDFKKGHDQQQQQTFGWLDSGWLERCFESSSLSEQGIHWVEMRRFGFNFKLYSTCHACKWPLFPDPWSQ